VLSRCVFKLPFGEDLAGINGRTPGEGYISDTVRQRREEKQKGSGLRFAIQDHIDVTARGATKNRKSQA